MKKQTIQPTGCCQPFDPGPLFQYPVVKKNFPPTELFINNPRDEQLHTLIEGQPDADTTIIFVHGFGTNKDEGENLFIDVSQALNKKFRTIRFDFSGYGQSQGRQEDVDLNKQAGDLAAVLEYTRHNYSGQINILAHSMGTYVACLLSPEKISKTIFTALASGNLENLKRRIYSRPGGILNEAGISIYQRTSGEVQKIGPTFWQSFQGLYYFDLLRAYARRNQLTAFHPMSDEIVVDEFSKKYRAVPNLDYREIHGSHNYSNPTDRKELINLVEKILTD